jgi:hypothetical protein
MGRYYFHLHEGDDVIADDEGRDLTDMQAALQRATIDAREIIAGDVRAGVIPLHCRIEIVELETGTHADLPFLNAVQIIHPG